ncbi:MAG TPA: phosphatidylserine/phosphatidylglycerophosphate/cardiolipin synthase family protein [Candidatus Magasanikbacteria bacterium]|nr:phosphatidylserine/phosphatidylglycerophosphate/cardiolipin synthase family protein [Candidatus Magasanikbacteria bacterium]
MRNSDYQIYTNSQSSWDAMYQAILDSQKSIFWELYIFLDDIEGKRFFDLLEQKSRAGLDVKLVVDAFGSFWLSHRRVESLRAAGVDILFFFERKKKYRGWWKQLISRTHRKILIVDEEIGFIGGVNVDHRMKDWLDIQVRVEGKIVHSLLRSFAKSYIICGGDKKRVKKFLKFKFRLRNDESDLILDEPHNERSVVRKKYMTALLRARERVILFSPYYFPDQKFLYALWRAKKRGVRIDLLLPLRTDVRLVTYAAYAWFKLLQKIGVNIHLTPNMMHGKGVIVDDDWAMIGSSNLDQVSFYDNYEANLEIKKSSVVKNLKNIVGEWVENAKHLTHDDLEKMGFLEVLKTKIAFGLYKLWSRK